MKAASIDPVSWEDLAADHYTRLAGRRTAYKTAVVTVTPGLNFSATKNIVSAQRKTNYDPMISSDKCYRRKTFIS